MTEDEERATAMLLGYDWYRPNIMRKRIGPNRFVGMADFEYKQIDTLRVIVTQSEIDRTTAEHHRLTPHE